MIAHPSLIAFPRREEFLLPLSEGEYKGVLPPRQIVSAYPQLRPQPKSSNPGIVPVVKWCGGSASNSGDLMGRESHGLADSPVDVARYRAVDDESGNLLVRAALGDEDRKGDVIDPGGWMVMFSRGLGGGDEMGVSGWRSSLIFRGLRRCRSLNLRKRSG